MANGKIQIQSTDSRIYTVTPEVGASGNVDLVLPKEGGTLATEAHVNSSISSIPVVPSASQTAQGIIEIATDAEVQAGTDTVRAVTPAGFKSASLGQGQTWQNVTGSRVSGATYTNTTGKPILVTVSITNGATVGSYMSFTIAGVTLIGYSSTYAAGTDVGNCLSVIVPNGATYSLVLTSASLFKWHELR